MSAQFDGSAYLDGVDARGLTDSPVLRLNAWIDFTNVDDSVPQEITAGAGTRTALKTYTDGTIRFSTKSAGSVLLASLKTTGLNVNDLTGWHMLSVGIDVSSANISERFAKMTLDGVLVAEDLNTTQGSCFIAGSDTGIGARYNGDSPFRGGMADFYMAQVSSDPETDQENFAVIAGGKYWKKEGSLLNALPVQPFILLEGDHTNFTGNSGTLGNFTLNGTLTALTPQGTITLGDNESLVGLSGYSAGRGRVTHAGGLSDGDMWSLDNRCFDVNSEVIEGVTFSGQPNGTIQLVTESEPPSFVRMLESKYYHNGVWTDPETIDIPVEVEAVDQSEQYEEIVVYDDSEGIFYRR